MHTYIVGTNDINLNSSKYKHIDNICLLGCMYVYIVWL